MDRRHGKRGAPTRNIRLESWRENFSSVFTSTKKKDYSFPECSTSPTVRSKYGFKTEGWKKKNWIETVCNITPRTLCFRSSNLEKSLKARWLISSSLMHIPAPKDCCETRCDLHSFDRLFHRYKHKCIFSVYSLFAFLNVKLQLWLCYYSDLYHPPFYSPK